MKIQVKDNLSAAVKIGTSRQVVIPKPIHDRLRLNPGDFLEVQLYKGTVVMTPKTLVDKQIMDAFRESMKDYRQGRSYGPFDTGEEAVKWLHTHTKPGHKNRKR